MKNSINKDRLAAALAVAGFGLAGCSAGGATASVTQAKITADVLTVAVGTANIFGDAGAGADFTGLNVASTFRQPTGALEPGGSAVLVSTPNLSGPFTLPATAGTVGGDPTSTILSGPAPSEIGGSAITATPQTSSNVTSFGTSGGAFGLGLEPFNYGDGTPFTNVPYPVPLYDTLAASTNGDPNALVPWGGPPAFDLAGNGQSVVGLSTEPGGQAGISEGLDVFAGVTPHVGTYTLSATIPANTSQPTIKAAATLTTTALLGAATPPAPTLDTAGGGSFTAALPAGVTEAYLQIVDLGPASGVAGCNGATNGTVSGTAPVTIYYTVEVTSGTPTGALPDTAGPGGTPSICTASQNTTAAKTTTGGDQFLVQTIGFDYPLYEASYTKGTTVANPSPTLTGANGQADITVSSAAEFTSTSAGATLFARHLTKVLVARPAQRFRR